MNVKITYELTMHYNTALPNCGFSESSHIITDGVYDFRDYVADNFDSQHGSTFQFINDDLVVIIDADGNPTGEAARVISREPTTAPLEW
jgi:hypothetical protein